MDVIPRTWNVRSLYSSGSLKTVASEMAKYNLDLAAVQDVRWVEGGNHPTDDYTLFPAGGGNFSLHHRVQNGSGAHPASYPMRTRGSFPGFKAAGAWSWLLTCLVPRPRMRGAIHPLPQYAFMACSVKAQGQLYLLPLSSLRDRLFRT
jgi:hypothetical protein